jgi:signal transduction histidine kinase
LCREISSQQQGLTNTNERLKAVDGHLAIRSQPQRGTSIRARVPIRQE